MMLHKSTSASFAHASFMDIWSHEFLKPVRELVDETKNCEDVCETTSSPSTQLTCLFFPLLQIAMAFIVPYITRLAPLIVEGKNKILVSTLSPSLTRQLMKYSTTALAVPQRHGIR